MKKYLLQIALALVACCAYGQGTLQFDQQVNPTTPPGGYANIVPDPTGESFTPTFSSVGFVQFYLDDANFNGTGSTISVNLWSGSLGTGTLLGTSDAVSMPDGFNGASTFFFTTPIGVSAGTTYYLQPVIQSGDSFEIGLVSGSAYSGGMAFLSGTAQPGGDLWFREGSVVPEPSSLSLAILGLATIYPILRNRRKLRT